MIIARGTQINRLVFLEELSQRNEHNKVLVRCHCACGSEVVVVKADFRSGHTRSCGCAQVEAVRQTHALNRGKQNLGITRLKIGDKSGMLTVLNVDGKDRHGGRRLLCRCECGNEKVIAASNVRNGKSKSCGCQKGSKLPDGEAQLRSILKRYIRQASERSLQFVLSPEEFRNIVVKHCQYCDSPPLFKKRHGLSSGLATNGIDRVNSAVGYVPENCVPCCHVCNRAKSNMSLEDFEAWISRVYAKTVRGK